ncbi:OB-fold protein [Filimonas effusa]|uniref:tRNA_anti-like n=1 Tax=Filimonas effusa TaxID=2508721 RepID=A0A4Q1D577_9BACT|nr:hypothetical protein [Filimonas effusa]RXK82791.1 hypothetical protein ESB13_11665 [Filimonas effusa]
MKRKNIVLFAIALLCLLAGFRAYYLYQKPRTTAAEEKTEITIEAKALYQAYGSNEQQAGKQFSNKILEVNGIVSEVQAAGNNFSVLLTGDEKTGGGVNCSITDKDSDKPVKGQTVKIKGRCTGFLFDVNISDASIISIQ